VRQLIGVPLPRRRDEVGERLNAISERAVAEGWNDDAPVAGPDLVVQRPAQAVEGEADRVLLASVKTVVLGEPVVDRAVVIVVDEARRQLDEDSRARVNAFRVGRRTL
jgi:hypothetical protein